MRIVALVLILWLSQQDISWLKLEQAKALSAHTGKLTLVYIACDPKSGNAPCGGGLPEKAFSDPSILRRQEDFHFVRACEKKTAQTVRAARAHEAIFLDPEGDEVHRSAFSDAGSLEIGMAGAMQKYVAKDVIWASDPVPGPAARRLLVVGFDDERGESLKVFEDRTIVKYHDRIQFVKLTPDKDGKAAKKWSVSQTPTIFFCDGSKENPEKNVLEKLTGKKDAALVRGTIQKALAKVAPRPATPTVAPAPGTP